MLCLCRPCSRAHTDGFYPQRLDLKIATFFNKISNDRCDRQVKTHNYGLPIVDVTVSPAGKVFSADSKILKVWDKNTGDVVTNIEPPATINGVTV